ncbi:MAG: tetratricopeptide repeat protein [Oceanipulchritudo sp.]
MSEETNSKEKGRESTRSYSAWLGFATREMTPGKSVRIHIRWGRVLVLLLVMGILGWAVKSWGLYYFFREVRDFEDVSFVDMIFFPMNRAAVRVEQGKYQIEQGKAALEREDYRRAFSLLREGVARSPSSLEGRMLLAQIYAGWRPELAADILVQGIEYGKTDTEYAKLTFTLLLSQKEDDKILSLTEEMLQEDLPEDIRQILRVSRLQAAMFHGKFGIARELFEETDLKQTMDGVILGTQLYSRTGRTETATEILKSVLLGIPVEQADPVYRQLIQSFKSREMYDEAREAALELVIRNPMDWQPRILLIDVLSASGRLDRRDREIEAMIREHRNDEQAMIALGRICAEYGNVEGASRLYEIALENGYALSLFSLTLAEAFVQNGDYAEAIDLCNELIQEDPSWLLNAEGSFNAIRSLAYFGYGDTELGNLYLKNFLDSRRTNVSQLFQAARRFRDRDLGEQALLLLEEAYRRDPKNEQVLATLIDVEMEQGAFFSLNSHLQALFDMRRPDYDLLENIRNRLQSDRFLFTRNRTALLDNLGAILSEREEMDWDIWERRAQEEQPEPAA